MRKARDGARAYSRPVSGTVEVRPALQALGRIVIEIGSRPAPGTATHGNESPSPSIHVLDNQPTPARCRRRASRAGLSEAVPEYPRSLVEAAK